MKLHILTTLLLWPLLACAQLTVSVSPVKTTAQKAVVPLAMQNNFTEKIESARAVCFILDEQGKMVGQATRWVIGGTDQKSGLAPGATNAFHFVVAAQNRSGFMTTNLTAKVSFSRVVLEGGKLADPKRVAITPSGKR